MKEQTVTLTDNHGNSVKFKIDHAEKILRLRNSVWSLSDANFEFDKQNGITRKNKKKRKIETESGDNQQSNYAPAEVEISLSDGSND